MIYVHGVCVCERELLNNECIDLKGLAGSALSLRLALCESAIICLTRGEMVSKIYTLPQRNVPLEDPETSRACANSSYQLPLKLVRSSRVPEPRRAAFDICFTNVSGRRVCVCV